MCRNQIEQFTKKKLAKNVSVLKSFKKQSHAFVWNILGKTDMALVKGCFHARRNTRKRKQSLSKLLYGVSLLHALCHSLPKGGQYLENRKNLSSVFPPYHTTPQESTGRIRFIPIVNTIETARHCIQKTPGSEEFDSGPSECGKLTPLKM